MLSRMDVQGSRPRLTGIRCQEDNESEDGGTTTLKRDVESDNEYRYGNHYSPTK